SSLPPSLLLFPSCEASEFGEVKLYDVVPNGRHVPVTDENKMEYIQKIAQFRLTNAIKKQTEAFLSGLHDLVPKDLVAIFTPSELELLSCGLPSIDLDNLKSHTELHHWKTSDKEIQWFWEVCSL
ncbi:dna binding protein ure-b1, partial [Nannochloropsis gaditana]